MSKFKATWAVLVLVLIFVISGCSSSAPKDAPAHTEKSKKEAAAAMASFPKVLAEFNALSDEFQANLGDMTMSEVDLDAYKVKLGELDKKAADILNNAKSMEVAPQYKEAQEMLVTGVALLEKSIKDVITYLDKKEKSLLNFAQEQFKQAKRAAYLAQTTSEKQAAVDGYTK